MKKSLLVLATSAALGLAAAPALAQQSGDVVDYLSGQLLWADVDGFDNALGLALTAGKGLATNFYVEGELTTTLNDAKAKGAGGDIKLSYWTLGAYGVYALPVGESFALRGRLGGVYINADSKGGSTGLDNEVNMSFGLGGIFDLTPSLNVIAEFTRVDEDVNHLSAGLQLKF